MEDRSTGFVQSFDRRRGYGFVLPKGSEEPVFFAAEEIEGPTRTLAEGQQVTFVLVLAPGRFEAKQLRP
ncbi:MULTISPECIES: cold-shock protein [Streptomyces]|uniref:Cold shock domain-containing protein n=1 Tax=Streptomyces solicathayae TaxID=3081768 RepID=A0ABZ0LUJ5_9ACTN|nr:cold shock domain-containing protein [Streptomyces sp. HUAS YS2]WOX23025.1 cold shock domain-containing protein [Streptomyces sp. HUAS YS2]